MAYLTCPTCRLTVYRPHLALSEDCPRCRAKLGRVSRLFKSSIPARLSEGRKGEERTQARP